MNWSIWNIRNLLLKLQTKIGHSQVVPTTPKTSREKLTLTVFEMQQVPVPNVEQSEPQKLAAWNRQNIMADEKNV